MFGNRHRRAAAWSVLALALGPLWAQDSAALPPGSPPAERLALVVRRPPSGSPPAEFVALELDPSGYVQLLARDRAIVRDFPLTAGREVELDLARIDVLAVGARVVVVDAEGQHDVPRPPFRAFRGSVVGDPNSLVTLSLFDDRIAGSIRTAGEDFAVGVRPDTLGLGLWLRAHDPDRPDTPSCAGDLAPAGHAAATSSSPAPPSVPQSVGVGSTTLLDAGVAIDATYEWYSHFGSLAAAQGYILSLIAQASAIYERDVDVRLVVPYLRVFTTPADPYTGGTTSTSVLLGELRSEWNAHQTGVARTVVHLFGIWPSGGAGVAYLDVLCDHAAHPGGSYDYGVSALSAKGGSWEKELVAHELGHNFSSPHTHCYAPEIDRCANQAGCYSGATEETVGTIMSYCDATDAVFHSRVQDQIRPAAEAAYPACMTLADVPQGLPAPENLHRTDTPD